ncbi:hypothetical protein F4824DRAFT_460154 [Ustulina deusta]|nr:hypothetical protein F4824DRAFT_460154 [Ustulina deusta]
MTISFSGSSKFLHFTLHASHFTTHYFMCQHIHTAMEEEKKAPSMPSTPQAKGPPSNCNTEAKLSRITEVFMKAQEEMADISRRRRNWLKLEVRRRRRMERRRRQIDKHADDAGLGSSMGKRPLDRIISEYRFLHVTPLFWTHRHEKVLHVVWQPFQPPPSHRLLSLERSRHPSQQQRRQRKKQAVPRKLLWKVQRKPRRRLVWDNQYRPLLTPSQLQLLLPSPHSLSPSPPAFFGLVEETPSLIAFKTAFLADGQNQMCMSRQRAMQILLSGVDNRDVFRIFDRIPPFRNFLRFETEDLYIFYGRQKYRFLWSTSVYRLDTKRNSDDATNSQNAHGEYRESTAPKIENFWRMVHLDSAHLTEASRKSNKHGRNFLKHGIEQMGMTMEECTVRYDYKRGDDEWSHPHFIPGVFIAMAQRYRSKQWKGQDGNEEGARGDTRDGQQECKHKHKHKNKHGEEDEDGDTSAKKTPETSKGQSVAVSYTVPTWQVIFTDSVNDCVYAHLYATQVPPFLLACFDKPAQWHSPVPPASTESNGAAAGKNGCKPEDVSFDFAIRHTRIAYKPHRSFRERLREAITCSRDSFCAANKDARPPGADEGKQARQDPADITTG